MMKSDSFCIVSLGCAKNTVDSQSMAQILENNGFEFEENPARASVIVVNTCGFIGDAREESYQVLTDLARKKKKHQLLVAAGCLTQRYREQVSRQIPGLDGLIGTRRWMDIVQLIQALRERKTPAPMYHLPDVPTTDAGVEEVLWVADQGASAYVKIADGCRRPCAFCAIPLIKGTQASRPMDLVLRDIRALSESGTREVILIAQDTTDYGSDLGLADGLSRLLDTITTENLDFPWLRIMYAYPGYVTDRMIELMATRPQILHYLDIPLQHGHPDTLKRMKRPHNMDWVRNTIGKMRTAMPDLAIRTTFIVGYPGETEREFEILLEFMREIRFDRAGAFTFSFESGTASESLGDPVPTHVKEERLKRLMLLQEEISLERNQSFVGKSLDVLIEGSGDGISLGRSYRDAPEIDGMVIIQGDHPDNEIVRVRIDGAMVHDLSGFVETI
jgi:ribosomal protein S12 methylthiotransferase